MARLSVNSLTPAAGSESGGTTVTISGDAFLSGATVTFGGAPATGVTVVNLTTITATTPPHAAGTVDVTVTNPGGETATLSAGFVYEQLSVGALTPSSIAVDTTTVIEIEGTGFAPGAQVSFENGIGPSPAVIILSTTLNLITVEVTTKSGGPPRPRDWDVRVTNPDGSSAVKIQGLTITP
jgi:hypothetical protein